MNKKIIGVAGLFDENTNAIFKSIKSSLKKQQLLCNELQPHITIGVYEDLELDKFLSWVEQFAKTHFMLDIYFNHIGFFDEEMCFIAPRTDYQLLDFHKDFHLKYDDFCGEAGYYYAYSTNQWSPHSTIVYGSPTEVLKSFVALKKEFKPFKGRLARLSVCELNPMKEIATFELKKPE